MMESKLVKSHYDASYDCDLGIWVVIGHYTRSVELVRSLAMGKTDLYCGNDIVSFLARETTARF